MSQHNTLLAIGVLTVAATASVFANRAASVSPTLQFEELSVTIEVNETDEDFAVVIAMEVAEAFLELVVRDPFENVALHLQATGPGGMALNEFIVEAERHDVQAGLAEFPAGWYQFTALGVSGSTFTGSAELSHELPTRSRIQHPLDGAVVDRDALEIRWGAAADPDHYVLEIEGAGLDWSLELPAGIHSFRVPGQVLRRGVEYQLGVSTVNDAGNMVVHEIHVTTATR
ncbi:MAG: fibronectin type III domain-containing protein [Planctomycetota bacterium]